MDKVLVKVLVSLLLVLLAAFSYFIVSELCDNSPLTEYLVSSIDDKTDTVMKLTSASAVASAGVSAIPGDTATPIAEKLADLTGYFLLILSVLYTEKALLTLFGSAVFKLLVPIACGFGLLGYLFWKKGGALAKSVALFALAILITIPASLLISDAVYNSYSSRLETTLSSTEELNEQTAPLAEAEKDMSLIAAVMSRISETAASLSERAAQLLNRYVESVAILVVTSCVLPLLGVIFILWMMKLLFGVDVLSGAERVREAAKSHASRGGGAKDSGKDP
nr:hypothetical protein [Clostridiales bacterium]